ncbi:MAG: EamA family transporter [Eubacteriaceae bacterium]|nr:EamA family transporter [Eubacteriaceae bacterium]
MKKGYLFIFLATLLFSSMEIALKANSHSFNPVQLNFLRFSIGALLLCPFAYNRLKIMNLRLEGRDFAFFAFTGFICIVISMTFHQLSVVYSKASLAAILFSSNPIFLVPMAHYFLKEKVTPGIVVSIIVSLFGMGIILNPFHMTADPKGILFAFLASFTFAIYSVMIKSRNKKYGGIVLTSFSFIMGSIELFILILVTRIEYVSHWLTFSGLGTFANIPIFDGITLFLIPSLIYIGVFVTGLGYMFYFLAMEETSASMASLVFLIKPALSPVMAFFILQESITANIAIGILIIMVGSGIMFISNNQINSALVFPGREQHL